DIPNTRGMRNDVVEALKKINLPVLRWPGGNFADEYHWKDGIGPRNERRRTINSNWGGVLEDNRFGTHEFMDLCELIGCEPYIAVNLGSGTIQEAADWVEYMTAEEGSSLAELRGRNGHPEPWKVKYLGIGNENWGAGGSMNVEYYASEYRRYQQFCKNYGDNTLFKIACGPDSEDYNWTRGLMSRLNHWHAGGISLHYYVLPGNWEHKGSALDFSEQEYYVTVQKALKIEEIMERHLQIMDECDPNHDIQLVIDEWGNWYDVEPGTNPGFLYQQNTMRDALVAGINLNIFNKHSDRVKMANIAQMVNVLQSVILTEGAKMIKTPTYHVFDMYKYHQDAELCDSTLETKEVGVEENNMVPNLTESVSVDANGVMHITMTNLDLENAYPIEAAILGMRPEQITAEIVTGEMHEKNTFEDPDCVKVQSFDGVSKVHGGIAFTIPACSVLHIAVS
ncbi:MAG: alpha-L-arabinofuranosidase C-terminal domain-containing protein, partial [Fusicatenibacter sp.]|nr:alpha-L-arabinofuranosidase C-terminal domain-containing protein [Fusicatenibacter sp.]